jgi:16S rRNA (guanine966-N2)-methyltransferase
MTRIIAGELAGRRLQVPARGARPTTDRVRESLFSALEHRLDAWPGIVVLDLFAGSGALGLEALSRGAGRAVLVERDRSAAAVVRRNAAALGVGGRVEVVLADALTWTPPSGARYGLVLADPPYDVPADLVAAALARLQPWIAPEALVVVERSARDRTDPLPPGWSQADPRRYGETALWYGRAQDVEQEER